MGERPEDRESHWWIARHALAALLVALVLGHQVAGYGALSSPGALLAELHADPADPAARPWGLGEELPYRYRPLFRALTLAVYALLPPSPETFYGVFVALSALSLLLAALSCEWLLRELGYEPPWALGGMALFLLGFPVLFSHDMPIHTREDFLGYACIALTLVAVARDRPTAVAALGVLGAAVRETCLLGVLPYALVSRRPRRQVLVAYAFPGASWLLLRVVRGAGQPRYDYLGVSLQPTLERPAEALLYLFACFGCLWIAAGWRLLAQDTPARHPLLSRRSVGLCFLATAATGWTLGMVREARITYILFPFVIPLALDAFASERVRRMARSPWPWLAGIGVLGAGASGLLWLASDPDRSLPALRALFGESFHFGVAQRVLAEFGGEQVLVEQAWASPLNGPWVLLHLAASVFLLVGLFATRGAPRDAPASGPSDSPADP